MSWQEKDNQLIRRFQFANFVEAFAFLTKVAILSEKHNHHPTIENTYNVVVLKLATHDAGHMVTQKDYDLAKDIDKAAGGANTVAEGSVG